MFASVYDEWYHDISDVAATVATSLDVANGRPILELGVGTGRIGIPLARAGARVVGLDSSHAMLTQCRAKLGGAGLLIVRADMARIPLVGEFGLVLVTFNTFFNLTTPAAQESCMRRIAGALAPDGALLIEAFVPTDEPDAVEYRETQRSDRAGGRVLTTSTRDPGTQTVTGVHIHTPTEGTIARLPWSIRYLHPRQIDDLCAAHGLQLAERWSDWNRSPFDSSSAHHVSLYRLGKARSTSPNNLDK